MLKVAQPINNNFHNFKCGEIFCISPAVYNVTCCLCATKMHLDQFPSHFQMQHLTLAEESINLEDLERKRRDKLAKDASLLDNMTIKEEDPEDDPIKQEDIDEDNKSLQELLRDAEKTRSKVQSKQEVFQKEREPTDLTIGDKLEIVVKKRNTRNSRNSNKINVEDYQKPEIEKLSIITSKDKDTKKELEMDNDELKEEYDDVDMDRDWSLEDKISDTDVSVYVI